VGAAVAVASGSAAGTGAASGSVPGTARKFTTRSDDGEWTDGTRWTLDGSTAANEYPVAGDVAVIAHRMFIAHNVDGVLIHQPAETGDKLQLTWGHSLTNCYILLEGTTGNPHFLSMYNAGSGSSYYPTSCPGTTNIRFNCLHYGGTDYQGDGLIIGASSVPYAGGSDPTQNVINLEYNILLPNGDSPTEHSAYAFTQLSATYSHQWSVNINGNTLMIGKEGACTINEGTGGFAGMIASFKNNLCWDHTVRTGNKP
jgi:hypothetical protein